MVIVMDAAMLAVMTAELAKQATAPGGKMMKDSGGSFLAAVALVVLHAARNCVT